MKQKMNVMLASAALAAAMAVTAAAADRTHPLIAPNPNPVIAPNPVISAQTEEPSYGIEVNGRLLPGEEACIMIPLRSTAEALGFTVTWDGADGIRVDNGTVHTIVTLGLDSYHLTTSLEGMVGMSAPIRFGMAPYAQNGVTYVPLNLFHVLLGRKDDTVTLENGRVVIRTEQEEETMPQIPNPFVTYDSMEEAAAAAGFSLSLPNRLPDGFTAPVIRVMNGEMIEAVYAGDDGELRIRKAEGIGNISGDYHEYERSEIMDAGGKQVTLRSSGDRSYLVLFTDGDYTYSIRSSAGMTAEALLALAASVS